MADTKISQDPTVTPAGADFAPIIQGGVNAKATLQSIADLGLPAVGASGNVLTVVSGAWESATPTPAAHANSHIADTGSDPLRAFDINGMSYHGWFNRDMTIGATPVTYGPLPAQLTTTTFTLYASRSTVVYYYQATKVTVSTNKTCTLDDGAGGSTAGLYYVYFNGMTGNILATKNFPGVFNTSNVFIATVTWNGTNLGWVNDERHGYQRNGIWHYYQHTHVGTLYDSGIVLSTANTGAGLTFATTSGAIDDEDITFTVGAQTTCRLARQTGATTFLIEDALSTKPFYWTGAVTQYVSVAGGYALSNATAGKYINVWIYATTDLTAPIVAIPETIATATGGYTTVALARVITPPNIAGLGISAEMKVLYRLIMKGEGTVSETTDYRLSSPLPAGGSASTSAAAVTYTPTAPEAFVTVQGALENRPNYNTLGALATGLLGVTASTGALSSYLIDTDLSTTSANDDTIPSAKATKAYTDGIVAAANALVYKATIDCSANPNYPAANCGDLYVVSLAGRIGGASGSIVAVGDMIICNTDSTTSGDQATKGTYWNIIERNLQYTAEDAANKVTSISGSSTDAQYGSAKLLYDQLALKANLISPSLTTPTLGVASATTINKVTLTTPATGSTLTIADGKTLMASNTLTLAGTDSTTMTFPSTSQSLVGIKSGALASGSANDLGSSTITTTGAVNTGVISATLSTNSIITRPSVIINNGGIAVGVGVGQAFKLTNWNGSVAGLYVGSAIDSLTTSAQTGAENANLSIKTMAGGSLGERLLVSSTGLAVRPTTASTSTTTGALTIAGGVGIAGTLNVASYIGAGPGFTAGSLHQLYGNTTSAVVNIINTNATSARGLAIQFTSLSSGTSANYYLYCGDTSGAKAEIRADGSGYFAGALEVPSIKITTGAGANKVLTSDAAGAATWQAVGGAIVQALGTKDTNYTCDFNSGRFATVTTGSGAATITIPDWASATVSVDAWLYITQGATARVQTLGAASGINNNIISSDGLMSAGDALPNSGASTTDAFQFTWTGTKWMVTNALFDVKA